MHKLIALYFFCLLGIVQSSKCSDVQQKSLVITATLIAERLMTNIEGKNINDITKDFLVQNIKDILEIHGINNVFQIQDFCGKYPYPVCFGGSMVIASCFYTTYRAIKCGIKYAKKRNK